MKKLNLKFHKINHYLGNKTYFYANNIWPKEQKKKQF